MPESILSKSAHGGNQAVRTAIGLYQRLLGPAWDKLPLAVRKAHAPGAGLHAVGHFEVVRGSSMLARILCSILRMPPSAAGVATSLHIVPQSEGECWHRTFGRHRLRTIQWADAAGLLVERFFLLSLSFRLSGSAEGLRFVQQKAELRLGRVGVRLPRFLAPEVFAMVRPCTAGGTQVSVRVTVPFVGLLIQYSGDLEAPQLQS